MLITKLGTKKTFIIICIDIGNTPLLRGMVFKSVNAFQHMWNTNYMEMKKDTGDLFFMMG